MKYTVSFEKEIYSMLRDDIGLCPYFRKDTCKLFENYLGMEYLFHKFLLKNGMPYLRNLLNNETSFGNPLFHLLFKAFVYAEIKFIRNYIPQNSHEERLTGHLISEIANSLNIITETFKQKAFELYNSDLNLEFHYADLSSNRNEKITGADFGLIFHINLPDYQEKVNVVKVQSKKFNGNAKIDWTQFETLERTAKESGYYCFYDMNINERNSPLMLKARAIRTILGDNVNKKQKSYTLQRECITDQWARSIPLSLFLLFDMLNPESENIKSFKKMQEAIEFIENLNDRLAKNEGHRISKILTVSVGGISNSKQDLRDKDISKLFSFEKYEDEAED